MERHCIVRRVIVQWTKTSFTKQNEWINIPMGIYQNVRNA
jgi:hypothetical protein